MGTAASPLFSDRPFSQFPQIGRHVAISGFIHTILLIFDRVLVENERVATYVSSRSSLRLEGLSLAKNRIIDRVCQIALEENLQGELGIAIATEEARSRSASFSGLSGIISPLIFLPRRVETASSEEADLLIRREFLSISSYYCLKKTALHFLVDLVLGVVVSIFFSGTGFLFYLGIRSVISIPCFLLKNRIDRYLQDQLLIQARLN